MRLKFWHILAIGAITGLILGIRSNDTSQGQVYVRRKYGALTEALLRRIQYYARKHNLPLQIALASIDIESGFDPHAYNPECTGGTASHSVRVSRPPYVICDNNSYRRYDIVKKKTRFQRAVDKGNPELWGSFGLTQMLPDTAWGWGYAPEQRNVGLFDIDTNLDLGLKKMAGAWVNKGNLADLRCGYVEGDSYSEVMAESPEKATRIVGKFIERVEFYERMFGLTQVRRYP